MGYDLRVLMPRAFQSGTVASPDSLWVQRFDYDQRGLAVRSHRAQDPNQAGTCATAAVTSTAPARFGFGSTPTCTSTTVFDDAGNPVETNTPGGKTVTHTYNLDRLVTATEATAPDGDGTIQTTARYDGAGRVVEATRPGADFVGTPWTTAMTYSPDGLVTATSGTDGTIAATTTNSYDPSGQLVSSTTGGTDFDGRRYLTPDVDQHSGGVWKMFDRRGNRLGTYDADLNRIGN